MEGCWWFFHKYDKWEATRSFDVLRIKDRYLLGVDTEADWIVVGKAYEQHRTCERCGSLQTRSVRTAL